jgi:chemotaxis protein CheX
MNVQTPPLDIRHYLNGHLVDVFQTMLSMTVTAVADGPPPAVSERVTGSVGLGGDTVTGAVYLHLSAKFASQITAGMLGLPPDEAIGETEVNDVIGECTNMLAGGLKSALCDKGHDCAVSTPAIIRGASFAIESLPEVRQERLIFDCAGVRFTVEVHIKFNQTN